MGKLKSFLKNLGYLTRYNLKKMNKELVTKNELNETLDGLIYQMAYDKSMAPERPIIKDHNETIDELINTEKSFVRFGDGEFRAIEGDISLHQKPDKKLSLRLKEILVSNDENIIIGVSRLYFYYDFEIYKINKNFRKNWVRKNISKMLTRLDLNKVYYDAACSQMYVLTPELNFNEYFDKVKKIWNDKDITIVCGETVFSKIEYNIFENAKSIEYIYGPSKNAFSEYDKILEKCKNIDKNRLIIIILGQTAKVLAYDLAKSEYRAIDFGHIAKDYDYFRKNGEHDEESLQKYFLPD